MKVERIASVPLITHDPYFSVWSSSDRLYEDDTRHWSQKPLRMYGFLQADDKEYCFMGRRADREEIPQASLEVTATSTKYRFENERAALELTFTSPLLLDDFKVLSRPCTYIRFRLEKRQETDVAVRFAVTSDFIRCTPGPVLGGSHAGNGQDGNYYYAYMYKGNQHILGHSGDNLTIDWGNVYLAAKEGEAVLSFSRKRDCLTAEISFKERSEAEIVMAFDDISSIHYLDGARMGYWKKFYRNLPELLGVCLTEEKEILKRCGALDEEIERRARQSGGEEYALLCVVSFRQVIAGHKLIADGQGNPIFLSKECDSNGCIGTVDVSYPSVPLFLCYGPELVKGLLRPVFAFASLPVWGFDFAPHDIGRYPYATGQVYGLLEQNWGTEFVDENGMIFPFYMNYPDGTEVYDFKMQMPVEECGNMLIMTAAVCCMEKNADFAVPYLPLLNKWAEYLIAHGREPGEQLCTDDFAGHLDRNVNLSAKAIMGIEAYGQIQKQMGKEEQYQKYHGIAKEYAVYLEENAQEGEHTLLAYGKSGSWSLKYNMVWDIFFGSHLFSERLLEREVDFYIGKREKYGVPLDGRKKYTKSDWILWCTAMTKDPEKRKLLLEPVVSFLKETKDRVPFSDWYDAGTGEYCYFKGRTVQGGIFMPMLLDQFMPLAKQ